MSGKLQLIIVIISLLLVACGGQASAKPEGDPEKGKTLFNQAIVREAPGCVTCHSIDPGVIILGPSLAGIGTRADQRIAEKTAVDYLRECITNPNAYLVEGFPEGVMFQKFKDVLTEDEIDNLVAYLLTLE